MATGTEKPRAASAGTLLDHLAAQMAELRQKGTYKEELILQTPQGPRVTAGGRSATGA